jgi:hypothetical protein
MGPYVIGSFCAGCFVMGPLVMGPYVGAPTEEQLYKYIRLCLSRLILAVTCRSWPYFNA